MASAIVMPKVGQSVESCMLSGWSKKVGDSVQAGEVLFSFETDKAVFDEEAKESGVLLATFYEEGEDIPCLTTIGVIGQAGENIDMLRQQSAPAVTDGQTLQIEQSLVSMPTGGETAPDGNRVFASPRAKNLAAKLRLDYTLASATGANGRIVEEDIRRLSDRVMGSGIGGLVRSADREGPTATPAVSMPAVQETGYTDIKLTQVRKITAKTMTESLSTMAQLTHNTSFDAATIVELHKKLKAENELFNLPKITLNDMILYAVSRTLPHHPELNAHFLNDTIRQFNHVHLGIAVDTQRGLLVPTLFNADMKSLAEISLETKTLVQACREGTIQPDQMKGASFTVSNLGSLGIESFTPIVNPPQVAILGVDCIIDRVRAVADGFTVYPAMGLSLTYDHRALDGASASRFLMDLCKRLESFYTILI